ncbi:hypothetical protein J4P02_22510 [Pseudomonas sp. NFXW11]|uniref:hypothetical protein n=1 Tax=Pseudomonas sp. NFXW11 TaxID=2819531 RepID=UPI003CFA3133
MLDTIHIIDEYLAKPKSIGSESTQNFTMPGREHPGLSYISPLTPTLSILPTSLVLAAVSAMPSLASVVSGDKDEDKEAHAEKERLLAAYVDNATFSPKQAKSEGYRFQPGHPMVGKSYRRHPLADFSGAETEHLYIPSEGYDAHVLEERESELIRLLVSLGATRISITKNTSNRSGSLLKAGGSIDAGPIAAAEAGYGSNSQHASGTLDTRVFNLNGCTWSTSRTLDRSGFFWLAFEPSWKAVLFAREHGGCTDASLELKENTSFSEDRNVDLSIKAKQLGGGVSVNLGANDNEERVHVVNVQFGPFVNEG